MANVRIPGRYAGNMNNLMKQAQRMQRQMEETTKALEEKEYTAAAGGGAVTVTVSGKKEVVSIKLAEEVVDPDDIEMLQDLIVAATNEPSARWRPTVQSHVQTDRRTGRCFRRRLSFLMDYYSSQISRLIEELSKLPGVGAKSAQRLAFHIINMPKEQVEQLAGAMTGARNNVRYCKECFTLTDKELCPICSSTKRDHSTIMVVENTRDLAAYEKTGKYNGVYHVLHGAISPMLGIGPNDIKLKELMQRLQSDVEEVIIATNSSLEGETTAMYISKLIKPTGIRVHGSPAVCPVGRRSGIHRRGNAASGAGRKDRA